MKRFVYSLIETLATFMLVFLVIICLTVPNRVLAGGGQDPCDDQTSDCTGQPEHDCDGGDCSGSDCGCNPYQDTGQCGCSEETVPA